jgi:hypothetical protein
MVRALLTVALIFTVWEWSTTVFGMSQTDNIYEIDRLAGHASVVGWWMFGIAVLFILDYRRVNND